MEPWFHSVSLISEKCKGCTNCIKRCPTEAIRVHDGKAAIILERCIDCGECIRICENHAKKAVGDSLASIFNFRYRIALPAPSLLAQFPKEISCAQILGSLLQIGFHKVAEVGCGADFTTIAIQEYLKTAAHHVQPLISSSCPAVTRLIQVRFPGLIGNLIPIDAPMVTIAKLARAEAMRETGLKHPQIGIFFITPCPAKITAIKGKNCVKEGIIDGAIPISHIFGEMQHAVFSGDVPLQEPQLSNTGAGWARSGGEALAVGHENHLAVSGIDNVVTVLEAIEMDKLTDVAYVDALACVGGCIGGALTVENPFVARMKIQKLAKGDYLTAIPPDRVKKARRLYYQHYFDWDCQLSPQPILQLDADVNQAIQKIEMIERTLNSLPGLDCGSCGSPNCRALAEDIAMGKAQIFDCIFKLREELSRLAQELLQLSEKLPPVIAPQIGALAPGGSTSGRTGGK